MFNPSYVSLFCPKTKKPLVKIGNELLTEDGQQRYPVIEEIPDCTCPLNLGKDDQQSLRLYEYLAPFYRWTERVFGRILIGVNILEKRNELAALIPAKEGEVVLEVSPGPGIYQAALASKVGASGRLVALDLSRGMLRQCCKVTAKQVPLPQLVQGNAAYLPFENNVFDGLFHFGGVNLFSEPTRALNEFSRVVKPGGWVVFGDEQFSAAWSSRKDWRAKVLRSMNPGFERQPPEVPLLLECLSSHEVFDGVGYLRVCKVPMR